MRVLAVRSRNLWEHDVDNERHRAMKEYSIDVVNGRR